MGSQTDSPFVYNLIPLPLQAPVPPKFEFQDSFLCSSVGSDSDLFNNRSQNLSLVPIFRFVKKRLELRQDFLEVLLVESVSLDLINLAIELSNLTGYELPLIREFLNLLFNPNLGGALQNSCSEVLDEILQLLLRRRKRRIESPFLLKQLLQVNAQIVLHLRSDSFEVPLVTRSMNHHLACESF